MKLNISRESLLPALQKIVNVIEKRQTMPILSNVLVKAAENELVMTGTDLEIQIITRINLNPDMDGTITIPAKKFLDICRLLPESAQITIEQKNDKVKVVSGHARFLFSSLPAEHYPNFSETDYEHDITINAGQLKKALDKTLFCMASQDVRYYLNGLFLSISKNCITLVASDGHRLSIYKDKLNQEISEETRLIIPRKAIQELSRLLDAPDEEVAIQFSKNNIRLNFGNLIFTAKLVDANYPDFNRVFEQDFYNAITIDKVEFKNALNRVSILSNEKYKGITLEIIENKLVITAHNQERDEAEEELAIQYAGESFSISFNSQYLLEAISNLDSEFAELLVASNLSVCFIVEPSGTLFKFIVMPMKL